MFWVRRAGLKKILKGLVPPIVLGAYKRLVSNNVNYAGKVFTGKFSSVEELRTNLKSETNYYWPQAVDEEFNAQKRRISEWRSECPPAGNFRSNFLPAALSLFPGEEIRVLDIGGGLNNCFEYLRFSLGKKIAVTVFDQSPSVKSGEALYRGTSGVLFTEVLPDEKDCFDVVYFGSSIQYFPDHQELLDGIVRLNPQLIVIADSMFGISETFVCAQVNMSGAVIPYTVINKKQLEGFGRVHGYELIHQSINYDGSDYFSSYEYPANLSRSWNLVFRRIGNAKQ